MMPVGTRHPDIHLYSDASGSFGCGAWWNRVWLQASWSGHMLEWSIAQKELLPIVLAAMVWGREWSGQSVPAHCNNEAVVVVVNLGYSKDQGMMHMIRCLLFILAFFDISLREEHIPGQTNVGADAISRNNLLVFFTQVPRASPIPTAISIPLMDLLVHKQPDWNSPACSQLFRACLQQV